MAAEQELRARLADALSRGDVDDDGGVIAVKERQDGNAARAR